MRSSAQPAPSLLFLSAPLRTYGGGLPPACFLVLSALVCSGCATAPSLKPTNPPLPTTRATPSSASIPIELASAASPTANNLPVINKATLDEARTLLAQARNELEPPQWELLHNKLSEAEEAFARFNRVATANGKAAQVPRGSEAVAESSRTGEATNGLGSAARVGPLLALLILLWPAETAGPEYDHGPDGLLQEEKFKAKLREVSKAAQQVKSELAASRRKQGSPRPRPPEVTVPFPDWKPGPGERWDGPCFLKGITGPGANLPPNAPPGEIMCTIQCGKYQIKFFALGNSGDVCTDPDLLARAQDLATRTHNPRGVRP